MAKKAASKRRRTAAGGLSSPRKAPNLTRGDNEGDEGNTTLVASPRKTRNRPAKSTTRIRRAVFSSDEEDEDEAAPGGANLDDEY
ncbi:unnamed protein product [Hymenolepis diminuta]|uniref:Uncharacterized protein n=1 Tax=Hymenolepis diminuta TaxID=6216 RepID=A0A0R3SY79_HYMDI|nr:unnamed protein product [Hymenolepis diminuta]